MDILSFKNSLKDDKCPSYLDPLLASLWYAARNEWNEAHDIVSQLSSTDSSWIHAHLHRIEGDDWNAGYWYRRAGREYPKITVEKEWEEILISVLQSL